MSDIETKALVLRTQAAALLEQAEALDGLRAYAVMHSHEYGKTLYMGWGAFADGVGPSQDQCVAVLDSDFEEDRETIDVHAVSIKELCGLLVGVRFPAHEQANDEDANHAVPGR